MMQRIQYLQSRAAGRLSFRIIGLMLFAYILTSVDLTNAVELLKTVRLSTVALAAIPFIGLLVFRCWRWFELARAAGSRLGPETLVTTCNESIWMGLASPARLGEFRRAVPLAREGIMGLAAASLLVIFELCMDLYAFMLVAASGLAIQWLSLTYGISGLIEGTLFVCTMVAGFALLALATSLLALVSTRGASYGGKFASINLLASKLADGLRGGVAFRISFQTSAALACFVVMMLVLLSDLGVRLDIIETAALIGLVGLSGAIPITYFGLGTREAVLIWFLGTHGYTAEEAIAVSVIFLIAYVMGIATSLLVGIFLRFYYGAPTE